MQSFSLRGRAAWHLVDCARCACSEQRSGAEERDCCFAQLMPLSVFKVVRCGSAGVEVQLGVIGPGALSAEDKPPGL